MQFFTEQGPSYQEVLGKVRLKYGERARIMSHRTIMLGGFWLFGRKEGIEVSGYIAEDSIMKKQKEKLDEEKKKIIQAAQTKKREEEKTQQDQETLNAVLSEVRALKDTLGQNYDPRADLPPAIREMEELLIRNEFSNNFIDYILDRLKKSFSMEDLGDKIKVKAQVFQWIREACSLWEPPQNYNNNSFILVGPTGVGKTTTIAKLAAHHSLDMEGGESYKVRIITIDNYRIAAKQQIETYGEIMGIPTSCVESFSDLKKTMALSTDYDLILVDTIGKSPRIATHLAEMKDLLEACGGNSFTHLAISATTKDRDILEILRQFEPFDYQSVVLTKIDETSGLGNIISILWEKQKSLSYITNGQRVPQDLAKATPEILLSTLTGFEDVPLNNDYLKACENNGR